MTLPRVAGHLPGLVEAALAAGLRTLDRLAVHAAGAGGGVAWLARARVDRLGPDPLPEGVVEPPPGAVAAPLGEVVVDRPPGAELLGQHAPLAARLVPIEDPVHD